MGAAHGGGPRGRGGGARWEGGNGEGGEPLPAEYYDEGRYLTFVPPEAPPARKTRV